MCCELCELARERFLVVLVKSGNKSTMQPANATANWSTFDGDEWNLLLMDLHEINHILVYVIIWYSSVLEIFCMMLKVHFCVGGISYSFFVYLF